MTAVSTDTRPEGNLTQPLLEVTGLSVRYGGVVAINDVSFSVAAGSFTGLIGPNGAGKTSLVDALTGYTKASGAITFAGRDLQRRAAHQRVRDGLARTFQSVELFDDLTVEENLMVAVDPPGPLGCLRRLIHTPRSEHAAVGDALDLMGLTSVAPRYPAELSHGQRKLVGVARALACRPKLLLLDEPAAGLDTEETEALATKLRQLPSRGIAVLLIDHDMSLVLGICDQVLVLEFGQVIADGPPAAIRADPRVLEAYLGGHTATESHRTDPQEPGNA